MADEVNENIFLVNAPAGSGKTTWIRQQVESYLLRNPKDNILCITYTNRAAEELGRDLEQSRVYFGTIHSFINDFIGSFFSHKEIIDLYWEVYETQIIERIKNTEQKETWTEGAERYKEKYGSLDLDTVRSNINKISYNETPFNSLLYGGLGHNDLITFTKLAVDRFPIIKKKISDKYQLIFIDEYQDTSAEVLHIFYTSLVGKKSKLYLLGDKMQQIYKNYNGEFEEKLETFNRSVNLSINYRTTPKIVDILNYIYNDEALKQCPYEKNSNDTMAFSPKVLIVSDVEKAISDFRKTYEDALLLYVSNRARFYDIGAGNLYDAYNKMEKYQFWKKYSAVDVMTKDEARINDALLSFLFIVDQIIEYYLQECYGEVFRNIHEYYMYFNSEKYIVEKHRDKKTIKTRLEEDIDLELRSDIEFIYLPMLDDYSEVRPRALNTRLSLEPEYFCSLIELCYKERNGEKREIELNKSLSDRLYEILFQFKVIPGIDWNGNFDAKRFDYWMKTVKTWSRDNDRYEVAMHTVGSGLSYAELDEDKLPQTAVIEELNRVENEELRRGYYLGIINQRGVHWIDPEGKPELELAEDYENRANIAESRGYSRYAGILRVIGDEFKREAKSNILEAKNGDDE